MVLRLASTLHIHNMASSTTLSTGAQKSKNASVSPCSGKSYLHLSGSALLAVRIQHMPMSVYNKQNNDLDSGCRRTPWLITATRDVQFERGPLACVNSSPKYPASRSTRGGHFDAAMPTRVVAPRGSDRRYFIFFVGIQDRNSLGSIGKEKRQMTEQAKLDASGDGWLWVKTILG